jgi:hypothetical protein
MLSYEAEEEEASYPRGSRARLMSPWLMKFLRGVALSATVGIVLVLTYHQCIWCVLAIALFSALTMNCIPLMPLVFLMSLFVLIFHAIDYQRASIRVEVPLQQIVYVPTWDDVTKYVKVKT